MVQIIFSFCYRISTQFRPFNDLVVSLVYQVWPALFPQRPLIFSPWHSAKNYDWIEYYYDGVEDVNAGNVSSLFNHITVSLPTTKQQNFSGKNSTLYAFLSAIIMQLSPQYLDDLHRETLCIGPINCRRENMIRSQGA